MIQATVKVTDNKSLYDAIVSHVSSLDGVSVHTGITRDVAKKETSRGNTLLHAAMDNEFGINVPERSFLRYTFDKYNKTWVREIRNVAHDSLFSSTFASNVVLKTGEISRESVRSRILTIRSPKNATRTVRRKGFNNPLIESRQLLTSIKYRVRRSGL